MARSTTRTWLVSVSVLWLLTLALAVGRSRFGEQQETAKQPVMDPVQNAEQKVKRGRSTFRFDTFGDEAFWGGTLKLHQAIEGARFGGVGPGVSPRTALAVGLKVDVEALPRNVLEQIEKGRVNLDDPAVTLALLKLNAVLGVTGQFNPNGSLKSMGIQCAFCHSTVDNSFTFGIGRRLDGFANRDLNVGAIIAAAPALSSLGRLLQ